MKRNYSLQRIDRSRTTNLESYKYKTRVFITQGRLHCLMFKVNNISKVERINQNREISLEGSQQKIEPFDVFREGKRLLSVFLEDSSSSLNFQVMEQSRNTSEETSMVPTILRCLRDLIAVMYKIGKEKTVIVYKLFEEEYGDPHMSFEERNFIPDHELDLEQGGRRRMRYRLKKLIELEKGLINGSTLHDMFFLDRETLCLMVNSDLLLWKISESGEENPETNGKGQYLKIKIRQNDDKKLNVRKFRLNRKNLVLNYLHGKIIKEPYIFEYYLSKFGHRMMAAGIIDLRKLKSYSKDLNLERGKDGEGEQNVVAPTIGLGESLLER